MKLNWRKFVLLFVLLQVVLFLGGCSAAWLGAVSGLLPALEAVVSAAIAFIMALEGKTVPTSVSSAIKKIGDDIAAQIANVQTLIADYKNAASTGLLSQIQAVFQGIVDNLGAILKAFEVTDPATVSKFTQLVGLAVAAAQAIIALIPMVIQKLSSGASEAELHAEDKLAAVSVDNVKKGLQEAYKHIRAEQTVNAQVNAALNSLPDSI